MKLLSELLNPVRMKVIQVISEKGSATPREIIEAVPGIPVASLYRHLKKLLEIGVLEVVSETPIRGTVEKTYIVRLEPFKAIEELVSAGDQSAHYDLFYIYNCGENTRGISHGMNRSSVFGLGSLLTS